MEKNPSVWMRGWNVWPPQGPQAGVQPTANMAKKEGGVWSSLWDCIPELLAAQYLRNLNTNIST